MIFLYEVFQWVKFFPEYFFHFPHPLMNPSTVTAIYNTHLSSFMVVWQESLNPNAKIVSVSFQNPFILDNKIWCKWTVRNCFECVEKCFPFVSEAEMWIPGLMPWLMSPPWNIQMSQSNIYAPLHCTLFKTNLILNCAFLQNLSR